MSKCKRWLRRLLLREKADPDSYVAWLRRRGVQIGEDVTIYAPQKTQIDVTCPWILTIGDHVRIAQGVTVLTHDYAWSVLKGHPQYAGRILGAQSPVTIGSNVFIGMNATITRGVTVGDHVIIGAGSVVTGDCESGWVYAGNPARKLMPLEQYYAKRAQRQFSEARQLACCYQRRFGQKPPMEAFFEYFQLFCAHDQAWEIPVFQSQMKLGQGAENCRAYMRSHPPMFSGYEAFLSACFADNPTKE